MSALSERYRDPDYAAFRDLVGSWIMCGGRRALAAHFEVAESTCERWYRGTAAPHPLLRDQVARWIAGRCS